MKLLFIFCLLLLQSTTYSQNSKDSMILVELLRHDYITMANNDFQRHKSNCTADYLLIENGEVMTLADEEKLFNTIAQMNLKRTDLFSFIQVRVAGNTAYAVYNLKSFFQNKNEEFNREWNESAVFRKIKGKWKIALIHSTKAQVKN